ncbi:DUF72 domain-containing protein [Aurantimonas endophytica]|uniref:Uncharacterized protein YecE (DUF72 family) n=1 Tax=Aurantimonas endophytica TaxID=1522175 RepID=A0A7W6MQA7_9HYPH|nr:DUF72 domain-containing protein [Aurantimonas endophytica]MBB4003870.1 uncharacterized protein YecE (DUF72 family) [Aurantimonas endophytica]MCO6404720.1 DUF72 domain-containing protein [Aurantimonas endophytica]
MPIRVGVAGWSIPSALSEQFPLVGTHLKRYGSRFSCVEINSSFYRPHRRATYERWAASVPSGFQFSVKLPKAITHERRLEDCGMLIERFAEETSGLGDKRGPVLVQLPPSLLYPGDIAVRFFDELKAMIDATVVLEPRHASWFEPEVDRMLEMQRVSRVAADPAKLSAAAIPGGASDIAYFRLHGSPSVYRSPYDERAIEAQAEVVVPLSAHADVWTIYDNTTLGAATANALQLVEAVR